MTNCGRSEDEVNLFTQSGGRKKQKTAKQSRKKSLRKTIKKLSKKKALKKIKNIIEKRVREIIRDNISKQKGGGTEGSNVLENILNAISKFFQDIWEYITKLFTGREENDEKSSKATNKSLIVNGETDTGAAKFLEKIKNTATESKLTNKELKTVIKEAENLDPYQEELDTITKERTPNKRPPNKRKKRYTYNKRKKRYTYNRSEKKEKNTRGAKQKRANETYKF